MIWTLRVKCDSGRFLVDDCVRVIEMKSDSSLLDLHDAIQDAVGFDQDHFFEFFAGRRPRNRKVEYAATFDSEAALDTYTEIVKKGHLWMETR